MVFVSSVEKKKMSSNVKNVDDFVIEKNVPMGKSFRSRPGKWQKYCRKWRSMILF